MRTDFDEHWRQQALAGDRGAIARLAQAALRPLFSFSYYRIGKNRHLCEEVVQETMVRAIRELDRYNPQRAKNDIFPWLTGLARNEIARALAGEKHAVSLEALWARMDAELLEIFARIESEPFNDDLLLREETRELVNTTMSQLPPHYRDTLEAKYVLGRSVREIAGLLKLPEKAAESQLTRAPGVPRHFCGVVEELGRGAVNGTRRRRYRGAAHGNGAASERPRIATEDGRPFEPRP